MDGYEVCRTLKGNAATKNIPVIFVTSKTDAMDETMGFSIGAVDFISKPIVPAIVKARVATQISLQQALGTLEQQNLELRKAAKLQDDVNQIMSHDLKSPLNSIIGFSSVLKESLKMDDEQEMMCQIVYEAGHKLLDMINIFLNLYKIEAGAYQFTPKPVEIVELVENIFATNARQIQTKGLKYRLLIDDLPVADDVRFYVHGEKTLCYSILGNLIQNAIEASPAQKTITVTLRSGPLNQAQIHNHGVIPVEIRDTFFEKYATFGKKSGTGLGTYSARLMAATQGGTVDFETSDDNGTTLTLKLPPAEEPKDAANRKPS